MGLFAQVSFTLAQEPSFYEEFDQQEELTQEEKKNSMLLNPQDVPVVSDTQNGIAAQDGFFLTDEKHAQFLQENEQYALADSMLNQTWKLLKNTLAKKEYRKLWQGHKVWLDEGRNTVAESFKKQVPNIPEAHAFMLATVAKTQELAQRIWHEPLLGRYAKDEVFVTLIKEENTIFLQGYGNIPVLAKKMDAAKEDTAKSQPENPQEKNDAEKVQPDAEKTAPADTKKEDSKENSEEKHVLKEMPQLLFRAELPKDGKLWLALTTVNGQKLYLLTTSNSLCIVHAPQVFSFDFNGVFVKK